MSNIQNIVDAIVKIHHQVSRQRSILVTLSGIDGCGKGYLTAKIVGQLKAVGLNAVSINGDGWLNLPEKRFNQDNSAEHFYCNAFRFDDMFSQLILPLREQRSISFESNFVEETATSYRPHCYEFENVDVIILEAIYLLQSAFINHYDFSIWIDCSFKTALERALKRRQEGLSAQQTVNAYRTIYFPAQIIHFKQDNPKGLATVIINNDSRISATQEYPTLLELEDFKV